MRYQLLDPLRGLAALWVFLFHYRFSDAFQNAVPWLHSIFKIGDRGVPMFFVISGFCLSASAVSAMRRSESPGLFLQRRAMRIYPTFWLSIVFILSAHFLLVSFLQFSTGNIPAMLQNRFREYDVGDYLRIVTLTQIFDHSSGLWSARFGKICGAYWTLAIEFQFYLIMTLALIRPRIFYWVLGVVSLVAFPVYLHPRLFFITANSGWFLPFWTSFALGILLFELLRRDYTPEKIFGQRTKPITMTMIIGLIGILMATVIYGYKTERLLFATVFTVCLWLAKPWNDVWVEHVKKSPGLFSRGLILLGAMSYSLYLIHTQIFWSLRFLGNSIGMGQNIIRDLLTIAITCVACYPFYKLCEVPFVKLCARKRKVIPQQSSLAESDVGPTIIPFPTNSQETERRESWAKPQRRAA